MDHEDNKLYIQRLLTVFQATLYNQLISVATTGKKSSSCLDTLPYPLDLDPCTDPIEVEFSRLSSQNLNIQEMRLYEAEAEHEMEVEIIEHDTFSHNFVMSPPPDSTKSVFIEKEPDEFIIRSHSNGLSSHLKRCRGVFRPSPEASIQFEFKFEEKSPEVNVLSFFQNSKVLQRMGKIVNIIDSSILQSSIPQEVTEFDTVHEFSTVSIDNPDSKTLYAEVIATTYSQGGDGFQLHSGDIVQIIQFLKEFHMVECRWQGMQGLFPADKIKVMVAPSKPLSQKIINLAKKELFNKEIIKAPSKLLERLQKKQNS